MPPGPGEQRAAVSVLLPRRGGSCSGTVYRQEALCQRYVKHVGCVVVSVEYRLAPQWKMPAPLEDCYAALLWAHENHEELGIDPQRLAVVSLSAGATWPRRWPSWPGTGRALPSACRCPCTESWIIAWRPPPPTRSPTPGLVPGQLREVLGEGPQPPPAHPV